MEKKRAHNSSILLFKQEVDDIQELNIFNFMEYSLRRFCKCMYDVLMMGSLQSYINIRSVVSGSSLPWLRNNSGCVFLCIFNYYR